MKFITNYFNRFSSLLFGVTYLQIFCYGLLLPPLQTITKGDTSTDFYLFILPLLFTYVFENIYDISYDSESLYNYDEEMKVLKSSNIIIIFIIGILFIFLIKDINILDFFHIPKKIDTLYVLAMSITYFFITFLLCVIQDTRLKQTHNIQSKNTLLFYKYLSIIVFWLINLGIVSLVSVKGNIFIHIGVYLFMNFLITIIINSFFDKKIEKLNRENIEIMKKFIKKNKES